MRENKQTRCKVCLHASIAALLCNTGSKQMQQSSVGERHVRLERLEVDDRVRFLTGASESGKAAELTGVGISGLRVPCIRREDNKGESSKPPNTDGPESTNKSSNVEKGNASPMLTVVMLMLIPSSFPLPHLKAALVHVLPIGSQCRWQIGERTRMACRCLVFWIEACSVVQILHNVATIAHGIVILRHRGFHGFDSQCFRKDEPRNILTERFFYGVIHSKDKRME